MDVSPRAAASLYRLARNFYHAWTVGFDPDWGEFPVAEDRERLAEAAFAAALRESGGWAAYAAATRAAMATSLRETGWDPGLPPATTHRTASGRYNWEMEDEGVLHLWIERPFGVVAVAQYYPETGEATVQLHDGAEERHEEYLHELLSALRARVTLTERVTPPAPTVPRRAMRDAVTFDMLLAG